MKNEFDYVRRCNLIFLAHLVKDNDAYNFNVRVSENTSFWLDPKIRISELRRNYERAHLHIQGVHSSPRPNLYELLFESSSLHKKAILDRRMDIPTS